MKKLVYDRKQLNSYKNFYEKLYEDMDGKNMIDWEDYDDLKYDANMLNEFLWYCHNDNIHFVFKNFDLEKIKNYKNYENFQWKLIIEVIEDFVKKYSYNTLDFIDEK